MDVSNTQRSEKSDSNRVDMLAKRMILPILRALPRDGIVIVYNGDNSRSTIPVLCLRKTLSKTSCMSPGLQPRVRVNPDDLLCDLSSAIILLMDERKRMVVAVAMLWL